MCLILKIVSCLSYLIAPKVSDQVDAALKVLSECDSGMMRGVNSEHRGGCQKHAVAFGEIPGGATLVAVTLCGNSPCFVTSY